MNTIEFDSTLTSFKLVRKGEDIYWLLQLKVIEDTSIRTLIKQFQGDIDFNGAFDQSAAQDAWEKLSIPLTDYNLDYVMDFSDLRLDAKLLNLSATRHEMKEGGWATEYVFTLMCDPDKDMIKKLAWFVKHKEEDPETGKKVIVTYPTVFAEPNSENT